jgi:hypothetical protein
MKVEFTRSSGSLAVQYEDVEVGKLFVFLDGTPGVPCIKVGETAYYNTVTECVIDIYETSTDRVQVLHNVQLIVNDVILK